MSTIDLLNQQVANLNLFYTKLHHYHWYVKGATFFELHAKFEELYTAITAYYDEIAERILMRGGSPISTLKESLAKSSLKEATGGEDATTMVRQVIADLQQMVDEYKVILEHAQQEADEVTADLILGISKDLQKEIWMLTTLLK
ncbi:Dps family protein [Entomospira culicis]|uniref:DNA starvation/stationary phase protection protein n=1 Tax=Entomospira culicis TaxID=2719989 RepID=A0A968GF49_9SPIO|nr:Dps family protein [Entomospira culicis]NIZ19247.1 DNA starvation/stationary phase protection protein [Entomospira culicis]NIZ69461.1 DNA starvation/stationary phase protection protein [Entomospira culicis]WDI36577.1 DNA starvation/stationary phase protection protein [Entomospira culicis]WDI38203.1 DNA starvation/stationary phase protection protein [Entomospira culicis]